MADGAGFGFVGPEIADDKLFGAGAGVGLRKGNDVLLAKIDKAIGGMTDDGSLDRFSKKYFPFPIYPRDWKPAATKSRRFSIPNSLLPLLPLPADSAAAAARGKKRAACSQVVNAVTSRANIGGSRASSSSTTSTRKCAACGTPREARMLRLIAYKAAVAQPFG